MNMRVAIRVDASAAIGTGHLKRCLSLAQALSESSAEIRFVCRSIDAVAERVLSTESYTKHWLPAPAKAFTPKSDAPPHASWAGVPQAQDAADTVQALADWRPDTVVVDHYAFDASWHRAVRSALGCLILVIDDTADRALDADALLDHNWSPDHRAKYAGRLQREPQWLCGPRFALLSAAYQRAPRYVFHEVVQSIGIFTGGTDPGGFSAQALSACRDAGFTGPIEVVSTSASPHLASLRGVCFADERTSLVIDRPDLTTFFSLHDIQIGASGGATWERCCIGAPSVLVALAENQIPVLNAVESLGLAIRSGTNAAELVRNIRKALTNPQLRLRMSLDAVQLIDGRGAERVAAHLIRRKT